MCGIIGVALKNTDNAKEYLEHGLQKMLSRGYDSAGGAVVEDMQLRIKKMISQSGKEDDLGALLQLPPSKFGIAHTRWATHGKVTEDNQHPHMDAEGTLAVIHNGTILNHVEIRKQLSGLGIEVIGENDSELLPYLIAHFRERYGNMRDALRIVGEQIEGKNAFVVLPKEGEVIYGVRKGLGLFAGVGDEGNFIASDPIAFAKHTQKGIYVPKDSIVSLSADKIDLRDIHTGQSYMEKKPLLYNIPTKEYNKGSYATYMEYEISQQPQTLITSKESLLPYLDTAVEKIRNARSVRLVGCGTAYIVAQLGAKLLKKAGVDARAEQGGETEDLTNVLTAQDLVMHISQSGATGDLITLQDELEEKHIPTMGLINVEYSDLAQRMDLLLPLGVGQEEAVASTKASSAQMQAFYLIYEILMGKKITKNVSKDVEQTLSKEYWEQSRYMARKMQEDAISKGVLGREKGLYILGKGLQEPIAYEAELKIREISYENAPGMSASGLKHGYIACIEEGTPCLFFFDEDGAQKTLNSAQECEARGAHIYGIGPAQLKDKFSFTHYIEVPDSGMTQAITNLAIAQQLALAFGELNGTNIDKPRNLAKCVTVE